MAGLSLTTAAFVVDRRPAAADGWEQLRLFTAEQGLVIALRRRARRAAGAAAALGELDLFDEAEVGLESSNEGRTWFVKEARLLARHEAIGRSYGALRAASALSAVVARNPVGPESRDGVYALLQEAFAAFAEATRPDIVQLKSIYRFARDEGYPVKQEWLAGLSAAEREAAAEVLSKPVRECAVEAEMVERLQRRLADYLRGNAELDLG